ncbi:diguanylate cyclase [Viridibacterium curvum]|uniref:Diguanylate cyclase n=1 Tax=Viridibacterium curvum TaxID=1101404 RepID=A0ABP9QKX8_9RHOO
MSSARRNVSQPHLPKPAGRWTVLSRLLVGVAVVLAAVVVWVSHLADSSPLVEALLLAALMGVMLWGAFRLANQRATARVAELHESILHAIRTQSTPQLPANAGGSIDALGESILELVSRAGERIEKLRDETDWYRQIADDAIGIEAFFSPRGRLLWLSPSTEAVTGYSLAECFDSRDIIDLWVYAKDRSLMKELARRGLDGEEREGHELRMQHRDGRLTWFSCRWSVRRDDDGRITGVRFSAQDIQRRKDVELKLLETVAALRRTQALKEHYLKRSNDEKMRLSSLLDTVAQGILFVDRDRRVVYINQPCIEMWMLSSRDAVVGTRDEQIIAETAGLRANDAAYMRHVEEVIASRQNSEAWDIELTDGRIISEVSSVVPSSDGTQSIGRVWVFEDVTAARLAERRLTDLAERDPLTGLYNRRRFVEELERRIADAERRGEELGLISFDLDGFKAINDTFGHQAGDEVLMQLSTEIGSIVRRNELFFRLGGDEFAILASNADIDRMVQLSRRVLARVSDMHFDFGGVEAAITVSIGIASVPWHARDTDALIAAADRAMYQAKMRGKNRCEVAEPLHS